MNKEISLLSSLIKKIIEDHYGIKKVAYSVSVKYWDYGGASGESLRYDVSIVENECVFLSMNEDFNKVVDDLKLFIESEKTKSSELLDKK